MNKSHSLTLAVCLALAGCTGSKQKTTWQKVRETSLDRSPANADSSGAYANRLHKMLLENKVEHKVVTYQFRYQTRLREEAVGTRTTVIYKDNSDPRNPWWLVNERTGNPVWLPGTDLKKQVAFYLQRNAEVTEQKDFSGAEPQLTMPMVAKKEFRSAPAQPTGTLVAKNYPVVPARGTATTQIVKIKQPPVVETTVAQAAPKVEPAPFIRPARFSPASPGVVIPYTKPVPEDVHFDDFFRRAHGTDYDSSSPLDRRKMETIKHTMLETREPAKPRTF